MITSAEDESQKLDRGVADDHPSHFVRVSNKYSSVCALQDTSQLN